MKKSFLLFLLVGIGCITAPAQSLTFKLGYFWPSQDSDLWDTNYENLIYNKSDMRSSQYGLELELFLNRWVSLGIEVSNFAQSIHTYYRDPNHADVGQNFYLSGTPLDLTFKFFPLGHRKTFIPYAGLGFGLCFWDYEQWGDFVIYPGEEIRTGTAETKSSAFGASIFLGSIIRFSRTMGASLEGKYRYVRDDLSSQFEGFEKFDLSGFSLTLGLNFFFR